MRIIVFTLLGLLTLCGHAEPPPGYKLAWADDFDGAQLDPAKWMHWLPGKRRHATNVPEAVVVADGKLTITTYTEGGRHFTGMISTKGLYERAYGYWEARIDFDSSQGMWSAFWSQTPTIGNPIDDPAKAGMEIDFVEHRSHDHEGRGIAMKVHHTLHWNGYGPERKGSGKDTPNLDLGNGFHLYACEWTEKEYRFYVDGKLTWTVTKPISQRPQFIILSSEAESGAWSMNIPKDGYGPRTTSKTRIIVDYVRHYVK